MDMSDVVIGDVVFSKINVQPINQAIIDRANALGGQMNAEAADQFVKDMSSLTFSASCNGNELSGKISPSQSYIIEYLKSHGTPVSGGDGGTAHNVDGSTYTSSVDPDMQGTPLPWYELPIIDGEDEAYHVAELMFPDAVRAAMNESKSEIGERVMPVMAQEISNVLGGGS